MEREIPQTEIAPLRTTAGLLIRHRGRILLIKQRTGGHYSIPKGAVKRGESLLDAAIRETREETGLNIPQNCVERKRYLCSVNVKGCRRKLFYFKVNLLDQSDITLHPFDETEIEECCFVPEQEAFRLIQLSQVGILWNGGRTIPLPLIDRLEAADWIRKVKHPTSHLYILSYTQRCKNEQAWNETTMWSRGLIINNKGRIISRPMKKFFEWHQLFQECRDFNGMAEVTEKIDGRLAISFFLDGHPYLASRGSFVSTTALKSTEILYARYPQAIKMMDPNLTYVFESVYPAGRLVLNYGLQEELILLDVIEPSSGKSVINRFPELPFPRAKRYSPTDDIQHYLRLDTQGHEGVVLKYPDGERIKVKYPWFKRDYMRIFHSENKSINQQYDE